MHLIFNIFQLLYNLFNVKKKIILKDRINIFFIFSFISYIIIIDLLHSLNIFSFFYCVFRFQRMTFFNCFDSHSFLNER